MTPPRVIMFSSSCCYKCQVAISRSLCQLPNVCVCVCGRVLWCISLSLFVLGRCISSGVPDVAEACCCCSSFSLADSNVTIVTNVDNCSALSCTYTNCLLIGFMLTTVNYWFGRHRSQAACFCELTVLYYSCEEF